MGDSQKNMNLALKLLEADTEDDVIALLRAARYWDDEAAWRLYGDRDGNFATIGNQQSRPEAALVEKLVNAVDARLTNECLVRGIDPTSAKAPQTIREAVARFIEDRELQGEIGGVLREWDQKKQREQARFITLAVTGNKPPLFPSLTVADCGEGQTPLRMPETFLSIDRANKLRVPFVQGKFNMGGTGALKFCGHNSLQLVLSRRNPAVVARWKEQDPTAVDWGFTIVRRERPTLAAGQVRNSVYKYLAPRNGDARSRGEVLRFRADTLLILPEQNRPYARESAFGSVVKLYEYDTKGFGSHALRPDGILSRLEILLPDIALPVRVHECRAYRGEVTRSFENSLVGIHARLSESHENLELGYPDSVTLSVHGEKMTAHIYAFKGDKAETYRTNEGIIFTVNGQTHGAIPKTFFDRTRVKMGRLARSILVVVDCSALSVGAREDLFMNSRDRLSNGELRKAIEAEMEELIGHHQGLRELRERRRSEEIASRLKDTRPLEDVLDSILRSSPSLSQLFLLGQRLSKPHRSAQEGAGEGGGRGGDTGAGSEFIGKRHPSYFRFHQVQPGQTLKRQTELGRRCRIKFDTDVVNDYFVRANLPGHYHFEVLEGALEGMQLDNQVNLHNGIANWSINLPEDRLADGDELTIQCTVTDETLLEPFVNIARLTVGPKGDADAGEGKRTSRQAGETLANSGQGPKGKGGLGVRPGELEPGGLQMPTIVRIIQGDQNWRTHKFDEQTACKVIDDGSERRADLTFYVNMDNIFLRTDMKGKASDVAVAREKFVYGNVLIGLALFHHRRAQRGTTPKSGATGEGNGSHADPIEDAIERTTRALAPFLVPMIDYLGALSVEEAASLAQRGDDE